MAEKIDDKINVDTSKLSDNLIAGEITSIRQMAAAQRLRFARKWYDNNFFDDGYHFRYMSRVTDRIVDTSGKDSLLNIKRTIPKASRQIRGMANLVLSQDFVPIVKPAKVARYQFEEGEQGDIAYKQALDQNKKEAQRVGQWLSEEWKHHKLKEKLIQMALGTLKHGISFLQVWPDAVEEEIRVKVYDAFDIYLDANHDSIYDSPFIGKAIPKTIREIKANENFDQDKVALLNADNKYASDEIKEAYLSSKMGTQKQASDAAASIILNEFYFKETLGDKNRERISQQKDGADILKTHKDGDNVIRQVFSCGGITLRDVYVDLPDYPFVDFRWEPGAIYQTPPMDRFISTNKGLDSIVARVESFLHTMNVGVWQKRKGEDFKISNVAGGLIAEYTTTPAQQMPLTSLPPAIFEFINLLNSFIDEQGVSTSALNKIPSGVKAWHAIESLKQSEYANLYTPLLQIRNTVETISEKMMDIAANHFITPRSVTRMERGEPDYFDVVGQIGVDTRKKMKDPMRNSVVSIRKDYEVNIEVQSGLAYTEEGKKGRMMEIAEFMLNMAQTGMVDPAVVKEAIKKMLEVYQFGPTEEMMDAIDQPGQMDETTLQQIKVAVAEVLKDIGYEPSKQEDRVMESKLGAAEAIKDTGLANKQPEEIKKEPSQSISFKDLPIEGKVQLAAKAGIKLDPETTILDDQLKVSNKL
jgi:hypothetical protein